MEFSTGETDISAMEGDTVQPESKSKRKAASTKSARKPAPGTKAETKARKAVTMDKDDRGSEELVATAAADAMAKAVAASAGWFRSTRL